MWKYTQKEIEEIYSKIDLVLDEEYTNMHTKINCRDNDGYKYFSLPMDVRDGKKPFRFHSNNPYTIYNIKKYVEINSIDCELLDSDYLNNSTKMSWKCGCGEIYTTTWNRFLQGQNSCRMCSIRSIYKKDINELKKLFANRNCTLLSTECYNMNSRLDYICNIHKEDGVQQVALRNFLYCGEIGQGCKYCGWETIGKNKRAPEDYIKQLTERKGFVYIGVDYEEKSARIKYICPHHTSDGVQFKSIASMKKSMFEKCPQCTMYRGEEMIKDFLIKWNIEYVPQKRFDNCRNILPLPFDIYLPNHNLLIEYDGSQHYKPTQIGNITKEQAEEKYIQTIIRDDIKTQYCKDNNIPLIRIPYWKLNNMECFLYEELLKYGINPKVA